MVDGPLVSVIVPIYKAERFLQRCVDSILAQTYPRLELILVDDGSPDGSAGICDRLAVTDDRIAVIHKENGGQGDARNAGVQASSGELICFVDADDYIAPCFVEYLLTLKERYRADIASCSYRFVYDGSEDFQQQTEECIELYDNVAACKAAMVTHWMPMAGPCVKLIPAEVVKKYPFPVNHLHEDEATTYKYYFECDKTVYSSIEYYGYFQYEGSITHNRTEKNSKDTLSAFQDQCAYFDRYGCEELKVTATERLIGTAVVMALNGDTVAKEFLCSKQIREYLSYGISLKTKIRYYGYMLLKVDLNAVYHKMIGK